tara:strand:+ start:8449 stop:9342 length:894 start_codon:yes stop_codon:yes gene_type:complete
MISTNIKNTDHLFKALKIDKNFLKASQKKFLKKNGYLLFKPTKSLKSKIKQLNTISQKLIDREKDKGGWEGKERHYKKGKNFENGANRLGNLINKNKNFSDLILLPEILCSAKEVIQDDIKVGGVDLRSPLKGKGFQRLHIDWLPRKKKSQKFVGVVCFVFLDQANKYNGPLRVVPGSHKETGWPDEKINVYKIHKKEKKIFAKAGSICVMNLNLWHGGSNNISGKPRKAILIDIRRRDQPQLLNFKKYISNKNKKLLSENHKYLLSIRKIDKNQKNDSFGPGDAYRKDLKKRSKND